MIDGSEHLGPRYAPDPSRSLLTFFACGSCGVPQVGAQVREWFDLMIGPP